MGNVLARGDEEEEDEEEERGIAKRWQASHTKRGQLEPKWLRIDYAVQEKDGLRFCFFFVCVLRLGPLLL